MFRFNHNKMDVATGYNGSKGITVAYYHASLPWKSTSVQA